MCAWPKGKPRGPRKKVTSSAGDELTLEQILNGESDVKVVSSEDVESESNVCPIEELPEWGLSFDSRNVTVYKRNRYESDEKVVKRINNEDVIVEYKAGDFGDWHTAAGTGKGPYFSSAQQAFMYIHRQNINNKIAKQGIVKNLADIIKDSENRIMKVMKS